MIGESIEEYHRQRDALVGRKADHLPKCAPHGYGRGVARRAEPRHEKPSLLRIVLHGVAFFIVAGAFMVALVIIAEALRK